VTNTVVLISPRGERITAQLLEGRDDYAISHGRSFEYQCADFWISENGNDYMEVVGPHVEGVERA
jgi:hypothetical protein